MPMARPTMHASASGRVEAARRAELDLQSRRGFEDAALALHFRRDSPRGCNRPHPRRTRRCCGLRRISSCSVRLIASTMVRGSPAEVAARCRTSPTSDRLLGIEKCSARSLWRAVGASARARWLPESRDPLRAAITLQRRAGRERLPKPAIPGTSVTGSRAFFGIPLGLGLVELLVVGERMRIRPDARAACTSAGPSLARGIRRRPRSWAR